MTRELNTFQAAVIGGGPVGLTTALILARLGFATAAIFPQTPSSHAGPDRRTAALFLGSVALLRNLDLWPALGSCCAPIRAIRIVDDRGNLLRAPETLFRAEEQDLGEFGFNVPNAALVNALMSAIGDLPNLTVVSASVTEILPRPNGIALGTSDGDPISADIVVGADGRNSAARAAAAIAARTWDYPQAAVVAAFEHQRPHHGISTEFHRPHGPLTTVPMPGNASSLVWVESRAEAARLAELTDSAFGQELEMRLSGLLGSIGNIGARATFPLSGLAAETMGKGRIALVGEAGHVMPPIGAQGLNLGLRDAAMLGECLAEVMRQCADPAVAVDRYARSRQPDVATRIAAIDALNRSILTDLLPAHLARGMGLYALSAFAPLRRFVVSEGLQPSLAVPIAMRPGGLAQLVRSSTSATQGGA